MVTNAPANSKVRSNSEMTAISLEPCGTATCPKVERFLAAQALVAVHARFGQVGEHAGDSKMA
jgi:hypothetical protein